MTITLQIATTNDLTTLLPLVGAYHTFEGIESSESERREALLPLLQEDSVHGRIWLIVSAKQVVGYIALCFGYSIEFGGRDAFVDELFVEEAHRGQGIGTHVLEVIKHQAAALEVKALHLEVDRNNTRARNIYAKHGFIARDRFHLMTCHIG